MLIWTVLTSVFSDFLNLDLACTSTSLIAWQTTYSTTGSNISTPTHKTLLICCGISGVDLVVGLWLVLINTFIKGRYLINT